MALVYRGIQFRIYIIDLEYMYDRRTVIFQKYKSLDRT